jgi:hypothetical protein
MLIGKMVIGGVVSGRLVIGETGKEGLIKKGKSGKVDYD